MCELQVALIERAVTLRPDVTRTVMGPQFRNMTENTYRHLRDWLIFRDYMNGLEFIVQVFEHFRQVLLSWGRQGGSRRRVTRRRLARLRKPGHLMLEALHAWRAFSRDSCKPDVVQNLRNNPFSSWWTSLWSLEFNFLMEIEFLWCHWKMDNLGKHFRKRRLHMSSAFKSRWFAEYITFLKKGEWWSCEVYLAFGTKSLFWKTLHWTMDKCVSR